MTIEKKILTGGCDGDTKARDISTEDMLNCMNARMVVSQYGRNLRVQNIPGTTRILNAVVPPYGTNQCLGSCVDAASNMLIYCLWNSFTYHGIYAFDFTTRTTYAVLYDSQVRDGLNFSKSYRIDRNCHVTNGLFYWCEGDNNQPRQINVAAGIKANHPTYVTTTLPYSFPIDNEDICIIKPPPQLAPNIQKLTDAGFENNFIANQSYEFAFMYDGYDGWETVTGTYSPASRLNKVTDTENYIQVSMDALQSIPQTVLIVFLVVRTGDGKQGGGNIANVIKTWDKRIASESAEIFGQNDGTGGLSFDFYGNVTGRFLAKDYVLKQADSVPLNSKTLTIAKNRNFLGNNKAGFNTPTTTSLSLTQQTVNIGGTVLNKNVINVGLSWGVPARGYSAYYVYLTEVLPQGFYEITSTVLTNNSLVPPVLPAPPPSVAFTTGLTFRGANQSDVAKYVRGTLGNPVIPIINSFTFTATNIQITGIAVQTYDVFKTSASYQAGTMFLDFAMRPFAVVTNDGLVFETPPRDFDFSSGISGITWTLSNANAVNEIPIEAYYYCPVRTLNLKTRFFVDGFTNAAKYATKNTDNIYQFSSATFVTGSLGIGLNQTALIQAGLGYTFTEGDICLLTMDNDVQYELPVIGQDGVYVIVKAVDLGDLTNRQIEYQLYTPYKTSDQEPYYQVGQMYRILLPGTVGRTYETLSDIFVPDAYAITRNYATATYFAEAMSPNDRFYQRWDNDGGKPGFVSTQGQVQKKSFFSFSNTYIPGTSVNGLSTFEPLNQDNVSEDSGEINKLILTTKIEDQGTVMLAICKNETNSIYLGEQQISDSSGATQFFAKAGGVVGTINSLKGSYGTINPESVYEYLGLVFWIDVLNGEFVQYSAAGLEPVSRYKMSRFFKNYSLGYLAANANNLDNINGFHHIPACVDPFNKESLITLPALIYENYATNLPSYSSVPSYATSIIDRFDIYDQLGKTMSFSYEQNKWGNNYEFMGEWYDYFENTLFGFKNGYLYIHNDDTTNWNMFYGAEYPMRICVTANFGSFVIKDLFNIAIEGNATPEFTVAMATYPNIQITDLASPDYTNDEGIRYATFLADRLSPNATGTPDERLYTGDVVKDAAIFVMCEFQAYGELTYIDAINIGYDPSRGQTNVTNIVNA